MHTYIQSFRFDSIQFNSIQFNILLKSSEKINRNEIGTILESKHNTKEKKTKQIIRTFTKPNSVVSSFLCLVTGQIDRQTRKESGNWKDRTRCCPVRYHSMSTHYMYG